MGFPYDAAVTYRPGCRLGPRAIRAASVQLAELKAFPWGFDLLEALAIVDRGDCHARPAPPRRRWRRRSRRRRPRSSPPGAKLLALGGDHFVAWPLLRAHAAKYGPLALVQVDAHGDLWPDDPGPHRPRHDDGPRDPRGAGRRRAARPRSASAPSTTSDEGLEVLTAPWLHRNGIARGARDRSAARAGDAPVYLSFDIDGLDPAFAPGTGTPVPGGLASWQALELVRGLGAAQPRRHGHRRGLAALRPRRDHRARRGAPGPRLALRARREGRGRARSGRPPLGDSACRPPSASEFIDRLPEAFRDWLGGPADRGGGVRDRRHRRHLARQGDALRQVHARGPDVPADLDLPPDDRRRLRRHGRSPTSGPSPTWC